MNTTKKIQKAIALVNHINNLCKWFNLVFTHEGAQLYTKLRRMEIKLHRLAEIACERDLTEKEEQAKQRTRQQVRELTKNWRIDTGIVFNTDPRGYAIKIQPEGVKQMKELGYDIHTDFGGYGILAPEF